MSEGTPAPALTWSHEARQQHRNSHDDDGGGDDDDLHHNAPAASDHDSVSAKRTETISDVLKQTQNGMENLLQRIQKIEATALDITEQINQKRQMAMKRKVKLEHVRERIQEAASSVSQIVHNVAAPDP